MSKVKVTMEYDGEEHVFEGDGFVCAVDDGKTDTVGKAIYGVGESTVSATLELISDLVKVVNPLDRLAFFTIFFEKICTANDYEMVLDVITRKNE